ncbi:hypothetical protein GWI33_018199, partial [Rhynchophorus ferrugineus]
MRRNAVVQGLAVKIENEDELKIDMQRFVAYFCSISILREKWTCNKDNICGERKEDDRRVFKKQLMVRKGQWDSEDAAFARDSQINRVTWKLNRVKTSNSKAHRHGHTFSDDKETR